MEYEKILEELLNNLPVGNSRLPKDTIARIFNREGKENFISDWIAYLLSPEKMGTVDCINALISLTGEPMSVEDRTELEIIREYTFQSGRRIDFLIESEDFLIAIENKLWSDLEKKQLQDYSKELANLAKEKSIIKLLLYPSQNKAENIKEVIKDSQRLYGFTPILYEDLAEVLKRVRIDCITNMRAAFMLQDFITYVEEYIMSNDCKTGAVDFNLISFSKKNQENIRKINDSVSVSNGQFSQYISNFLSQSFSGEEWDYYVPKKGCNYYQLYKKANVWGKLIHFELLGVGEFPPDSIKVVLHTNESAREGGRTERIKELQLEAERYLKDNYGTCSFKINYESDESFAESMNMIFDRLKEIVNKYTCIIDEELRKNRDI